MLGLQEQDCGANAQSLILVRAQPEGWCMWGRGWTFAAIGGPSVSEARTTTIAACPQAPQGSPVGVGLTVGWECKSRGMCVQDPCPAQKRIVPDLWTCWHILAVGCVPVSCYFPSVFEGIVRRQTSSGIFSLQKNDQNQRQGQNAVPKGSLIGKYHRKVK